ncbi:uncharacterized protein LOC117135018 isoform X2 [Drosophila busckii]|uniref:uncharacterized protein LOC117135018 isoform X2 n=1 Tax=Drosophila busckii TaxID=30019 RepID=UPI00143292E1|nr:uncharacterized protein LOC117135018 isoform X2 [Drosophila busckii]
MAERDIWFTTKLTINDRILVDYFQTNTSEAREKFLWFRTNNLRETLNYYGIHVEKPVPYNKCYYHASRANIFTSGYHNMS